MGWQVWILFGAMDKDKDGMAQLAEFEYYMVNYLNHKSGAPDGARRAVVDVVETYVDPTQALKEMFIKVC